MSINQVNPMSLVRQPATLSALNDQELVHMYQSGNDGAFSELVHRHKSRVYTAIYLFVRDEAEAEDLFQEVFIRIVDTLRSGRYNDEGKFLPWVLRVAHNLCVDRYRRDKRHGRVVEVVRANEHTPDTLDLFKLIPDSADTAETHIIRSQTHEHLRELMERLPPEQREVIILRHYADLTFQEIADLTRVSINTALGRMRYALNNIRRMSAESDENQLS